MNPFDFVSTYHKLTVHDPKLGISFTGGIWMYVSGSSGGKEVRNGEYNAVMSAIAVRLKLAGPSAVPATFYLNDPQISPTEPFFQPGIRRAYAGRGSADEIRDATRLAVLTKRCKAYEAKTYMEGWFGQDCNSFAGNYQGISPNHSIRAWAKGYKDNENISGATNDVYVTEGLLPLPVVTDPAQITTGTIIITDSAEKQFRHIAVVNSYVPITTGSKPSGTLEVAEWGQAGKDESAHARKAEKVDLLYTETPGMGKTKVWAFKDGTGKKNFRFFLDASKLDSLPCRGWHVGNQEGV